MQVQHIAGLQKLIMAPHKKNVQFYTLKEETFAEETFTSGKIREIFGRNFREFRELANFGFFARIIFRENYLSRIHALNKFF